MEGLQTAALLERIALIAKLATSTDCDHVELERVDIWIAEMAVTAKEELIAVIFDVNGAPSLTQLKAGMLPLRYD